MSSHSNAEKIAHLACHALKEREVQALALTAGGVALKAGAVILAAPVAGPLAVAGAVGAAGYGIWKWLSK